jgi:hypothetical protein
MYDDLDPQFMSSPGAALPIVAARVWEIRKRRMVVVGSVCGAILIVMFGSVAFGGGGKPDRLTGARGNDDDRRLIVYRGTAGDRADDDGHIHDDNAPRVHDQHAADRARHHSDIARDDDNNGSEAGPHRRHR